MYNKKILTSFAFSKPAGKYVLSYTLKKGAHRCFVWVTPLFHQLVALLLSSIALTDADLSIH